MRRRIPYITHYRDDNYKELAIASLIENDEDTFFHALIMIPKDIRIYNELAIYAVLYGNYLAIKELLLLGASNYKEMINYAKNDYIKDLILDYLEDK